MRKIIVSNLMSLDGYLEGPDRELDWFVVDDEFFAYAKSIADEIDAMLFGRVTYQMMADYWTSSAAPEQNDAVIVRMMNETPKVVFSRTLDNASWGKWDNARLVKQDAATEVRRLKSQPGKNMVIFGSVGLISTLAPAGLIDEYRIILNPVILGRGRSMFRDIAARIKLKLLRTHTFKSGVVMLYYRPDENP
jgi:dihydrofolate reductase